MSHEFILSHAELASREIAQVVHIANHDNSDGNASPITAVRVGGLYGNGVETYTLNASPPDNQKDQRNPNHAKIEITDQGIMWSLQEALMDYMLCVGQDGSTYFVDFPTRPGEHFRIFNTSDPSDKMIEIPASGIDRYINSKINEGGFGMVVPFNQQLPAVGVGSVNGFLQMINSNFFDQNGIINEMLPHDRRVTNLTELRVNEEKRQRILNHLLLGENASLRRQVAALEVQIQTMSVSRTL